MTIDNRLLLRVLASSRGRPLTVEELMQRARIDSGAKQAVKRALFALQRAGEVARAGKRWSLPREEKPAAPQGEMRCRSQARPPPPTFERPPPRAGGKARRTHLGTLKRHPEGYGFVVLAEGGLDDVFLPPGEVRGALDGDLVEVEIVRGRAGRPAGRLVRIVERRRTHLLGVYSVRGREALVAPLERTFPGGVRVALRRDVRDGQVVSVRIRRYPGPGRPMEGSVEAVVGHAGDPRVESLMVAQANGFEAEFPPAVITEAERVPSEVGEDERRGRRDLRGLKLVTIDGEDARDFDDAVYVERTPAGWRLVVAIADVAHYVRAGTALDEEARRRGTSVYFPSLVVPMLPERLSNGICSLNPGVDRLCMVADMTIDPEGRPLGVELYEAVMRSRARLTYTMVAEVLSGKRVEGLSALEEDLGSMAELAATLTRVREARGAIDLDIPEARVELDAAGEVRALVRRERTAAHRLVEEFMLAANEAVARYFAQRGLPTLYRVHAEPDDEKLAHFATMARAHGFTLVPGEEIDPRALNAFLKRLTGRPEQKALNMLLLRSMMQALYSAENIGHFGLAAPFYLHFTSPIRRYPDLVVHRLLKEHWARGGRALSAEEREQGERSLVRLAELCSERERAAMDAEREILAYHQARFMRDKVGQVFAGTVAGVAEFGLFVELAEHAVDGLVRSETIGEEWRHDERAHTLAFPRSGRTYRVGDRVRVVVLSADPARRRIDLGLAPAEPEAPRREERARKRRR